MTVETNTNNSISYVAEKIRDQEIYPKVTEMLDFIISNFEAEMVDVKNKWTDPNALSEDTIKEIIKELGFTYIKNVMDTITNFQFNTLLQFVSLIGLLKGHRDGLELVLKLLGFDSIIVEWWETTNEEPWTFEIIILMNSTFVPDIFKTLDKLKIFISNYVFPTISNIDFRFNLDTFGERAAIIAGFVKQTRATDGPIARRA